MINLIVRLIVSTVVVLGQAVYSKDFMWTLSKSAVIAAIVMGLLNTFVKPILQFLSLPITIVTLGLFYFVIDIVLVYACAYLVDGFSVSSILAALLFSIGLSIAQGFVGLFLD